MSKIHRASERVRAAARMASLTATALLAGIAAAHADEGFVALGAGYFDVWRSDDNSVLFSADVHFGSPAIWVVKPMAGVSVGGDGQVYGYAGIYADLALTDTIYITPSLAAGAYSEGSGKDLGNTIEFRSSITVSYRFESGLRAGINYAHISNAGLDDDNPGADIIGLSLGIPFSTLGF